MTIPHGQNAAPSASCPKIRKQTASRRTPVTPSPGTLLLPTLAYKPGFLLPFHAVHPPLCLLGCDPPIAPIAGSQWKTCPQKAVPSPTPASVCKEGPHLKRILFKAGIQSRWAVLVLSYVVVHRQHFSRWGLGTLVSRTTGPAGACRDREAVSVLELLLLGSPPD